MRGGGSVGRVLRVKGLSVSKGTTVTHRMGYEKPSRQLDNARTAHGGGRQAGAADQSLGKGDLVTCILRCELCPGDTGQPTP